MRGKPRRKVADDVCAGITPADAGKTPVCIRYCRSREDHPRGCGENFCRFQCPLLRAGSPPRMRGKLPACISCGIALRITPADAGKTLSAGTGGFLSWDHPRGCGENSPPPTAKTVSRGSPPRMRGKHCGGKSAIPLDRITPADAGKTM